MTFKDFMTEVRPKTLTASASSVIIASALTYSDGVFNLVPALLCLGVAIFAQIASNFANDYFDFKNGMDGKGRLGPERAVATGHGTARQILSGAILFVTLSCICGLGLLFYAPLWIVPIGILIAIGVFAYSAGPYPLSHHGLGDVAVLIFFGIIPVCLTYYVQAGFFSLDSLLYGIAIGLVAINILIVNNYRDVEQDKSNGKNTTIVIFGRKFGLVAYLSNIIIATAISIAINHSVPVYYLLPIFAISAFMISTWVELKRTDGQALNAVLGRTARNVLIYALFNSILLLIK